MNALCKHCGEYHSCTDLIDEQADRIAELEKQTKPLSDVEIEQLREYHGINEWLYETSVVDFVRAIEERHGIK